MGDQEEATPTLDAADMALVAELGAHRLVNEGDYPVSYTHLDHERARR